VPPAVDACDDAPPLNFVIGDTAEPGGDQPRPESTVDTTDPASGIPDGTYEMTLTRQQAIDACMGEETAYDESILQLVLDRGSWEVWVLLGGAGGPRALGATGTYELSGPSIVFAESGILAAPAKSTRKWPLGSSGRESWQLSRQIPPRCLIETIHAQIREPGPIDESVPRRPNRHGPIGPAARA
jgi:hypothetical protein